MKKVFKVAFVGLLSFVFRGCKKTEVWEIKKKEQEKYFCYELIQAPEKYSDFVGMNIWTYLDFQFPTEWIPFANEEGILKCLKNRDFEIRKGYDGKNYIVLPPTSVSATFSQEELLYVWDTLSQNYADFDGMQSKGFSKKKLLKIKNEKDFFKQFDKWIDDGHFAVRIKNFHYNQPSVVDEGCFFSRDPQNTYFEKETSNAYYIRFNSCGSEDYNSKLYFAAMEAEKKEFIVLDARSNIGGDPAPTAAFRNYLQNVRYPGTVIVLQDNWSFSAGELWRSFGTIDVKFKCILVGTHSGGAQRVCYNLYENKDLDISIVAGRYSIDSFLPENYLGEGKGFKPQIWATTPTMKETLEKLGVDLEGITLR